MKSHSARHRSPQSPQSPQSPCVVCGNQNYKWRFEKKGRQFWRCQACKMEAQFPLPTLEQLKLHYDTVYDHDLRDAFGPAVTIKKLLAKRRMREVKRYLPGGRWLDVGAANGAFVANAIEQGINAEGIELSDTAARVARDSDLPVRCIALEDFVVEQKYRVVTAFDVIEHVLDPQLVLQKIGTLLDQDGHIVITTPDLNSIFRRIMGSRWYFYIPEEHLFYFSPTTIKQLLRKTGYETERITRTYKSLSFDYALTQFKEYNPLIHNVLNRVAKVAPASLRSAAVPLYIGELMIIARRA